MCNQYSAPHPIALSFFFFYARMLSTVMFLISYLDRKDHIGDISLSCTVPYGVKTKHIIQTAKHGGWGGMIWRFILATAPWNYWVNQEPLYEEPFTSARRLKSIFYYNRSIILRLLENPQQLYKGGSTWHSFILLFLGFFFKYDMM